MRAFNSTRFSKTGSISYPENLADGEKHDIEEIPLRHVLDWVNLCLFCAEPLQPSGTGNRLEQTHSSCINIIPFQPRLPDRKSQED